MVRDSSELTDNEVTVDYLVNLKKTLRELKKSKLNPNTPELYLGLLGEFGLAKWLKERNFIFDHRTCTNPSELSMDFVVFGAKEESRSIRVDVKTSGIRPPKVSRIISVDHVNLKTRFRISRRFKIFFIVINKIGDPKLNPSGISEFSSDRVSWAF